MTASEHLAQFNVTVAQAKEFILSNIESPLVIFVTCKQFGVTAEMLAEIYGGVTAGDVVNFFSSNNLNGHELLDSNLNGDGDTDIDSNLNHTSEQIELATAYLEATVELNQFEPLSILSIDDVRNNVINDYEITSDLFPLIGGNPAITGYNGGSTTLQGLGSQAYFDFYDPDDYAGHDDGVLTSEERGGDNLGSFAATSENIELHHISTIEYIYNNLDAEEWSDIFSHSFNTQMSTRNDLSVVQDFTDMFVEAASSETNSSFLTENQLDFLTSFIIRGAIDRYEEYGELTMIDRVIIDYF